MRVARRPHPLSPSPAGGGGTGPKTPPPGPLPAAERGRKTRAAGHLVPAPPPPAGEGDRGWGPPNFRPGLSLIEVLLALTILLLSMVAIGRLVDIGSDHAAAARLHSRGTRLAQAKLAEVEAGVVGMDGGSGSFDTEAGWSWTVEAQPQGPPNLYAVTVKVSFDDRGRPFEVTLSQLVLDPAKMGSAAQAEKPTEADVQAAETNAEGM